MTEEVDQCECGYPDGSFACRIRHIHLNTGDAKASRDSSPNFGFKEER